MIQAKKSLGQHFLHDQNIARKIAETFLAENTSDVILEVGPGTGALTKYLLKGKSLTYFAIETDERMIEHLHQQFPQLKSNLIHDDFLEFDFSVINANSISIIGNFPYNISSQILFRIFENKEKIPFAVGMFQKEVAQRIASKHGNKEYGILSVLLQAFYEVKYLFEVNEQSFSPPPKVKSAVIQLHRKENPPVLKKESFFRALVKAGFNQRRKTLRNSLSGVVDRRKIGDDEIFSKRAEQLSVEQWINLANQLSE
jgi:16S rRNA (adenine1518-N6/adenine1519-N6)-dimethyltransferase